MNSFCFEISPSFGLYEGPAVSSHYLKSMGKRCKEHISSQGHSFPNYIGEPEAAAWLCLLKLVNISGNLALEE